MLNAIRHFCTNIICAFIWNKYKRKKMRVLLNSNILSDLIFIKRDIQEPIKYFKTYTGYMARSLVINVNNKWVYKFPLCRENSDELSLREKRIVDAISKYISGYIPPVEILEMPHARTGQKLVRKYPFVSGVSLRGLPVETVLKHKKKLAHQLAVFLYETAVADPAEIRDLKIHPILKSPPIDHSSYMVGWFQGDIADNFLINPKTCDIVAFIDWEDSRFIDFSQMLEMDKSIKQRTVLSATVQEYALIWQKNHKTL